MVEAFSTTLASLDPETAHLVQAAAAALSSTLEVGVDFWRLEAESGDWTLVPLGPAKEHESCLTPDPSPPAILRQSVGSWHRALDPVLVEQGDGRILLALPIRGPQGNLFAATATLVDAPTQLVLKLARLFQSDLRLQQELRRYREDLNTCAVQIGTDFEELAFLRRLADHLDMSEVSQGAWHVAQMVLPLLATVVQSESLVLVTAAVDAKHPAGVRVDRPVVWVGPRRLNDEACRRFIETYRSRAADRPVVQNHLPTLPEGREFPGVRKFVMAPLTKGECTLGWLVAINHLRQQHCEADGTDWPLSQFEFGTVEAGLLSSVASMLATHARNVELFREKEALLVSVVRAMVSAIDAKDPYTCGHSERVALVGQHLAKVLGLNEVECERLYLAGLLHDLGKLGVPDAVLHKPGQLTDEEQAQIRPHPERGWAILQDLDQLEYLVPGVLHHHEKYDGTGYPDGLAGDRIPLPARILAVADAYDAMVSDRPYRKGMPEERVERTLREGAGSQWDPRVIDAFFRVLPEIKALWHAYRPQVPRLRRPEGMAHN